MSSNKLSGPVCAAALEMKVGSDHNNTNCFHETGYQLDLFKPATPNDLPFICKTVSCKSALDLARSIAPAECVVNEAHYLYQDVLNPIIRQCANLTTPATNASGSASTGEAPLNGSWTITPTPTPAPTTRAPSYDTSSFDSGMSIPTWWIVIAVLLNICMIIQCIRRCRSRRPSIQRNHHLVAGHGPSVPVAPAVYVQVFGDANRRSRPTPSAPLLTAPAPVAASPVRCQSQPKLSAPSQPTTLDGNSSSLDLSKLPLLNDQQIIAVRVPFEKISFGALINRGGFGEVYRGTYKDQDVAIKQMLPAHGRDTRFIHKFLSEVKLMSSLEHERIVRFVGVAWDSVSDICILSEFMEGGDLRSVLARYDAENRSEGFDLTKLNIALHVAHALTYMHSLQSIVLHRDLKSSNILLSPTMDAKVTDFGVSRERIDATMTRGVGTSLWMAPEIMMGGRYNEKADVFSFGVVLSELDSNKLPYASQVNLQSGSLKYRDLMQNVAQGRMMVDFSYESDPDIVALGRDCVAVDPNDRPTAAEALHRVHQVLRQYQHTGTNTFV